MTLSCISGKGKQLFDRWLADPTAIPVSYTYDGIRYHGFPAASRTLRCDSEENGVLKTTLTFALADTLQAPETPADAYEEDWRQAILASAVEHVLTKTALSERDRAVYRAYVQEGRPIAEVAAQFKLSRNSVSQIKTRIDKRIVAVGRELVAGMK